MSQKVIPAFNSKLALINFKRIRKEEMNVQHKQLIIKCPNTDCLHNIRVSIGTYLEGPNDLGGWILQCRACETKFPFSVRNAEDASSVRSGARILDCWDDELEEEKDHLFSKHGINLSEIYCGEKVLVPDDIGNYQPTIDTTAHHLYVCAACREEIETEAYAALRQKLNEVNAAVGRFLTPFIKGYANTPEGIRVSLPMVCKCGRNSEVVFYKPFTEIHALSHNAEEFWLIRSGDETSLPDVDGVYTRNECFGILEKLLLRWQASFHAVFIIVPFVGLQFPGTEAQRLEQWNRVLAHTHPDKTAIITRRGTFKLLQQAAEAKGVDFAFLDKYGLLNETIRSLSEKKAFFKQDSHAKIYCAMSSDRVELMSGSFNIHEGEYMENVFIKSYELHDFFSRYMLNLGIWFDVSLLHHPRYILELRFDDSDPQCSLDKYTGYLHSSRIETRRV